MRLQDKAIARYGYRFKFYIDVARGLVGWFTGWLPEIVSVGLLLHFFGLNITRTQAIILIPVGMISLWLFGLIWYKLGLYNTEKHVIAKQDPIQREIYEAALKINNKK